MLELDFDGLKIQDREIWVHPVGHGGMDWDYRAGVLLSWQDGGVVLQTIRFFNDCGAYVHATVAKFPDRPFPTDKEKAIGIVKNILGQFAAALVAAFPVPVPCPTCNGSGADLYQGEGSCEACQGYGAIQP